MYALNIQNNVQMVMEKEKKNVKLSVLETKKNVVTTTIANVTLFLMIVVMLLKMNVRIIFLLIPNINAIMIMMKTNANHKKENVMNIFQKAIVGNFIPVLKKRDVIILVIAVLKRIKIVRLIKDQAHILVPVLNFIMIRIKLIMVINVYMKTVIAL